MQDIFVLPQPASSSSGTTPARPRKRKRQPDQWKRNIMKSKRAKGEVYISPSTGKKIAAAEPGPPCKCKQRCYSKFTDDERERVFTCFWKLGDKSVQDAYLHGLIRVKNVARRRPRSNSSTSREATFVYVVS